MSSSSSPSAAATAAAAAAAVPSSVRIVVLGDGGTGKSSLILAAATESFPEKVAPLLPPLRLPPNAYPDNVPITIVDTSSRPEDQAKTEAELGRADVVVLTYACDRPATLDHLPGYWLPELRRLQVMAPIVVVGCRLDLRSERQPSLEDVMGPVMHQFREIESCLECSALRNIQVVEVFYYAQKAVLYPTAPLFDQQTQTLKPRCVRALKRIFTLCDHDKDGALNDVELNDFQVQCFGAPLQAAELAGVKRVVQDKMSEGVNDKGLTLSGFLFLHALFIERGRLETTWTVLRHFGYGQDLQLRADLLLVPSFKRMSDQSVELTEQALQFLEAAFRSFDADSDEALRAQELEELFSTAASYPWQQPPHADAAETNEMGAMTLNGFLSQWVLMTLLEPVKSLAHLLYLGYPGDPASAFRITRRRRLDRKKQSSTRNVLQCFVFGKEQPEKDALLDGLIGQPVGGSHKQASEERYAINSIQVPAAGTKFLVMRDISEQSMPEFLDRQDCLAPCDVSVFLYDSSSVESWDRARELLEAVAARAEDEEQEMPCLFVAAKDDLDAPTSVSMRSGDSGSDVHIRVVQAALKPHLNIPETTTGKAAKQYKRMMARSVTLATLGIAVLAAGIIAYKVYNARRQAASN
eukprot:SM000051S17525  [mRNA]  locus=s51:63093:67305:- [translate_table: standard]